MLAQYFGGKGTDVGGRKLAVSTCNAQSCCEPMNLSSLCQSCQHCVLHLKGRWYQGGGCPSLWLDLAELLIGLLFQPRALNTCLLMLVASEREDLFRLSSMLSRSWLRAPVHPHCLSARLKFGLIVRFVFAVLGGSL